MKMTRLRITYLWLFLVLLGTGLNAEIDVWSCNGPGGGGVSALAINPLNTAIVYAGTARSIYKSTDSGKTWNVIYSMLPNDYLLLVKSIVIDPLNPTTIYAVTMTKVLKSIDEGASWEVFWQGNINNNPSCIAIDPKIPNIIYFSDSFDLMKSINGGASWNIIFGHQASCIAIDPINTAIIYASAPCLIKSTDGGVNWSPSHNGLPDCDIFLKIDPQIPTTIYAVGSGGIYKSINAGAWWNLIDSFPAGGSIRSIAFYPQNTNIIYVARYKSLLVSMDGGGSWTPLNPDNNLDLCNILVIDPLSPSTIYAGTSYRGVFKSTNSGGSWAAINSGLNATRVSSLAIDPLNPDTVYAGTYGNGVFKSTDSGSSWISASTGLRPDENISSLAIDPLNTTTIYAGLHCFIFKSTDGGTSWSLIFTANGGGDFKWIAIDPKNSLTLYAGMEYGLYGLIKSTNGGVSWSLLPADASCIAIDPQNTATIYAAIGERIYKSTDGAISWDICGSISLITAIAINPINTAIIYAGTEKSGIFKSTNSGKNWIPINSGLSNWYGQSIYSEVVSLAIDPQNPETIYAGFKWDSGVFKSRNEGGNWKAVNSGLSNFEINSLVINPSNSSTLHAGTSSGVFSITFTTPFIKLNAPTLMAPSNGATGQSTNINLQWLRQKGSLIY